MKSILRQKIASERIVYRDAQTYFSIFLDDNNRKPICRLYFNSTKKYFSTFDEFKNETKVELLSLDDIFNYVEILYMTVDNYERVKELV